MRGAGLISLLITVCIAGYLAYMQMGGTKAEGGGGGNYKRAEESAQRAAGVAQKQIVQSAIQAYYGKYQKYPPDLDALVKEGFIERVPDGLKYNPENGSLE